MANPQIENGYLKIANELSNRFCRLKLSGNEWNIVWAVIRKTYGFNKKRDQISLTQFTEITGLSRPTVVRCISKLVSHNILGSIKGNTTTSSVYWIAKDHEKWHTGIRIDTSSNFATCPSKKKAKNLVASTLPTKDNTKDNIKDNQASPDPSCGKPKELIDLVHKRGFNISQLINTFKKKQRERKVLYEIPATVYIEVCKEFLSTKRNPEISEEKEFPYFMRVLEDKSEKYFANREIKEHQKYKKSGMPQKIKDLFNTVGSGLV